MNGTDAERIYLQNDRLKVEISVPGTYYKGSRFDWNGFITQVTLDDKHTFCVPESLIEGIGTGGCGFCGEFGIQEPVGYDEALAGERFPKIGVGLITKPDMSDYDFFRAYEVTPFNAVITKSDNAIEFSIDPVNCNGYSVLYKKRISVAGNLMTIEYNLINTGEKAIHTTEYCHNFMRIDNEETDSGYTLKFPYEPVIAQMPLAIEQKENLLTWKDEDWGRDFYCIITGFEDEQAHSWELYNSNAGVGVKETDDFKPTRVALWGMRHVISPEAFIEINIEPGAEQKWSRKYEFYKNE